MTPDTRLRYLLNPHFWVIAILTIAFSLGYYGEHVGLKDWAPFGKEIFTEDYSHDLHRALLLIPMVYAAAVFRLKAAIAITVIMLCVVVPRGAFVSENPDPLLRPVAFMLVSGEATVLLGLERDRRERLVDEIRMRQKAEEERSQLAFIVESSDDAIIGKTLDGIITSWNTGAEKLYGYEANEVIGQPLSMLLPPDSSDEPTDILGRIATGNIVEHYETVRRTRDGRLIDVALTVSPIKDASGAIVGASAIARDITEKKRAEEEIRLLNERLEERVRRRTAELDAANKELEAFAYSVSHDLRAPLRSIDGFGQALLEDCGDKLDEEGREYLDRMRLASQRMGELIDDLLGLSRVTRAEMHRQPVDMTRLVRQIADELKTREPDRQVTLVIADGIEAEGDPHLLRVALENLVGNAWKFTSKRADARIEFGASDGPEGTVYFVRDNGAGFNMAYVGKLFGAFQRLHAVTEYEGTGIGLATVQRIIRRHGGRVWAEAAIGEGATFYFTLKQPGGQSHGGESDTAGGRQPG